MGRTQSRSRFAKLAKNLRELGGTAAAGTPEGEYANWKKGINKINVTRRPPSEYLQRFTVGVLPFAADLVATPTPGYSEIWAASMTVFSDLGRTETGILTDANLNYELDPLKYSQKSGYFPAILKWRVSIPSAAPTTEISGVTKQPYKRRPTQAFSIPFGRTADTTIVPASLSLNLGTVTQNVIGDALAGKLKGLTLGNKKVISVSMLSEELKDEYGAGERGTNTATGLPPIV